MCVDLNRRGDRGIELPHQDSRVSCEALEAAERVAHTCAAYRQPCELVVCEAYHRVLVRRPKNVVALHQNRPRHRPGRGRFSARKSCLRDRAGWLLEPQRSDVDENERLSLLAQTGSLSRRLRT